MIIPGVKGNPKRTKILIDGEVVSYSNYNTYIRALQTVVCGDCLITHFRNRSDQLSVRMMTIIAEFSDGREEIIFNDCLSYEALKRLYELRLEEKMLNNTAYGLACGIMRKEEK